MVSTSPPLMAHQGIVDPRVSARDVFSVAARGNHTSNTPSKSGHI
jgi:hypothetical protein